MNRLKMSIFGVLGFACMTQSAGAETLVLRLDMPRDVLSVTHGGAIGLPLAPPDIKPLRGDAIKDAFVLTAIVRDADGQPVGIASEIEHFPQGKDGDWHAWWTLMIPGRGSLYGYEIEAVPDAHKAVFATAAGGKDWAGTITARVATGPAASGDGIIAGGTGEFAGAVGTMSEWATLTGLTRHGAMSGYLEIRVNYDLPAKPVKP